MHLRVPALGLTLPIPEGGKEPLRGLAAGPVSDLMVLERGLGPLLTATHEYGGIFGKLRSLSTAYTTCFHCTGEKNLVNDG